MCKKVKTFIEDDVVINEDETFSEGDDVIMNEGETLIEGNGVVINEGENIY